MELNLTARDEKASVIHTACRHVAGSMAEYRLLREGDAFLLQVAYGDERIEIEAGYDFARAVTLFEALRCGGVTPCTAGDVVRDLNLLEDL